MPCPAVCIIAFYAYNLCVCSCSRGHGRTCMCRFSMNVCGCFNTALHLYTRCGLVGGVGVRFYGNTDIYTNVLAPSRPYKLRLPVPPLQWSLINIRFIPPLRCSLLINRHLLFALWAPRISSAVPSPQQPSLLVTGVELPNGAQFLVSLSAHSQILRAWLLTKILKLKLGSLTCSLPFYQLHFFNVQQRHDVLVQAGHASVTQICLPPSLSTLRVLQ